MARAYTKPLRLNEFQRDVVLGAVKGEILKVERDTNVPRSLKILALAELRSVVAMMEDTPNDDET